MRPDAMKLNVVLTSPAWSGENDAPEPRTVQISGNFGDVDPLTEVEAQALLPKLAYIFEALVKEFHAAKGAHLQRLALMQQAQAQQAAQQQAEAAAVTNQEAPDEE